MDFGDAGKILGLDPSVCLVHDLRKYGAVPSGFTGLSLGRQWLGCGD